MFNLLDIDFMHFSIGEGADAKLLLILIPIIVLQIILIIFSLNDIKKAKLDPKSKIVWILLIICVAIFGSIIYFIYRGATKNDSRDSEFDKEN